MPTLAKIVIGTVAALVKSAVAASDPEANDAVEVVGISAGMQPAESGDVGVPIAGVWGTLTLHADGSYVYAPLPAANVDLVGGLGTDAEVIGDLITRGKLLTEPSA